MFPRGATSQRETTMLRFFLNRKHLTLAMPFIYGRNSVSLLPVSSNSEVSVDTISMITKNENNETVGKKKSQTLINSEPRLNNLRTAQSGTSERTNGGLVCIWSGLKRYRKRRQEMCKRRTAERELNTLHRKIEKLLVMMTDKETDKSFEEDNECVVCMGAKATMQTFPCQHCVVCRKCFIQTIQSAIAKRSLPLRCVFCRERVLKLRNISAFRPYICQSHSSYYLPQSSSASHTVNATYIRRKYKTKGRHKSDNITFSTRQTRYEETKRVVQRSTVQSTPASLLNNFRRVQPVDYSCNDPMFHVNTFCSKGQSKIVAGQKMTNQALCSGHGVEVDEPRRVTLTQSLKTTSRPTLTLSSAAPNRDRILTEKFPTTHLESSNSRERSLSDNVNKIKQENNPSTADTVNGIEYKNDSFPIKPPKKRKLFFNMFFRH